MPLVQMGNRPSPIGLTSLLFYTHFKITFLSRNSVSLPLVQMGGEQHPLNQPVYYFISNFFPQSKNTVLPQLQNTFTLLPRAKKYDFALCKKITLLPSSKITFSPKYKIKFCFSPGSKLRFYTSLLFYTYFKITVLPTV
ncbi:hypothetical protein Hanom_Chr01g00028241 [Helianthus anomalus]